MRCKQAWASKRARLATDDSNTSGSDNFDKRFALFSISHRQHTTIKNCAPRQARLTTLATSQLRQILSDDVQSQSSSLMCNFYRDTIYRANDSSCGSSYGASIERTPASTRASFDANPPRRQPPCAVCSFSRLCFLCPVSSRSLTSTRLTGPA